MTLHDPKARAEPASTPLRRLGADLTAEPDASTNERARIDLEGKGQPGSDPGLSPASLPSTGVRRLDELLGGSMPERRAALVYGPPFIGKEVLARLFALSAMRAGQPAILVLAGDTAEDVRAHLTRIDAAFPDYEEQGLVRFVDAYSRSVGAEHEHPRVTFVDGPMNLNQLSRAVNDAQREALGVGEHHHLVFDSLSTLIAYSNAQTAFRFLQVFLGKAKRAGATAMVLMDRGMHSDAEVQMIKHLVDGVIEVKTENAKTFLQIEGLGVTRHRGWVEYAFSDTGLDITGSFAAGRIR